MILGPRIAVPKDVGGSEGLALDEYLSQRLLEDLGGDTQNPLGLRGAVARYEKEKNASECRSLIQQLVSELDPYTTDLHRNLASLPFRLVLSATQDRMIFEAFRLERKPGVQQACYDYCRGIAAEASLTLPTENKPIVYSLFGRHDQPQSMVLNDKNLLDYLVRITRETPALPDAVRAILRAPSTVFLFVGFGFSNWWLRLLLKVLEVTGVENRGVSLALEDNSSSDTNAFGENRRFFESVGIYIQPSDDWNSLAKDLAATFRSQTAGKTNDSPAPVAASEAGRPLVFLSYASEDAEKVDLLKSGLQHRGVSVWLDKQNLRSGQNWLQQIERIIGAVDYFIFVQSPNMDRRDREGADGIYNLELKKAILRQETKPFGAVFLLHVTMGSCQNRPEPELSALHRISIDADGDVAKLAQDILKSYEEMRGRSDAHFTAQVG
jgi:hypothetical protein